MKTLSALFTLLFLLTGFAFSQTDNYNDLVYRCKQSVEQGNIKYNMNQILEGRAMAERALQLNDSSEYALYYLAYADYSLATLTMNDNKSKAKDYIDEAIKYAEKAVDLHGNSAESLALLGTIYGVKITFDWNNAVALGPKSNQVIAEALAIEPGNPRVLLQAGINKMFTPEFFGGSKTEAFKLFVKAADAFNTYKVTDSLKPDWGKLQSLAWLGRSYEEQKDYAKAVSFYKKALSENPDYAWVKYKLLPAAEEKLGNK